MYKDKIREVIFGYRTRAGKLFDIFLLIAILLSVIGVILDSESKIHTKHGDLLLDIEWGLVLFTIEYILRIYCVRSKRKIYFFNYGNY